MPANSGSLSPSARRRLIRRSRSKLRRDWLEARSALAEALDGEEPASVAQAIRSLENDRRTATAALNRQTAEAMSRRWRPTSAHRLLRTDAATGISWALLHRRQSITLTAVRGARSMTIGPFWMDLDRDVALAFADYLVARDTAKAVECLRETTREDASW